MILQNIPRVTGYRMWCQAITLLTFLFCADVHGDLVRSEFNKLALGLRVNLHFEIGGVLDSPLQHDQYAIAQQFSVGGTLTISLTDENGNLSGPIYEPQAGDAIQLFVLPANTTGNFNAIVLPDISAQSLAWDTQHLVDPTSNFAGQLRVVGVPEASQFICFSFLGVVLAVRMGWLCLRRQ